jgi:hypothetical protein
MALKKLLTDLTTGVNAYPNHNTPSTSGGFNYGKSNSIFDTRQFNQKSFEFGKGTAFDRPDGGFSNEPYLYSGLLAKDSLPKVNNPGDQGLLGSLGATIDKATDGVIRGGLITAANRSFEDTLRIGKWAFDLPEGPMWLLTQTGLNRSNPKIEEGKTLFGGRSRIYNPLGLNTLSQTLVNFTGLHINRAGALPTSYGIKIGYNVDSTQKQKYEYRVRRKGNKMKDKYQRKGNFRNTNRLLNLYSINSQEGGARKKFDFVNLYEYSGGPHSLYGIGRTEIKHYDNIKGVTSKFAQLKALGIGTKQYNAGIEGKNNDFKPYKVEYIEKGTLFDGKRTGGPYADFLDIDGRKLIYKNTDFDVDGKYKVVANKITDYRKSMGRGFTDYQQRTGLKGDGVKYIREERVNTGNPGKRINRSVDKLGRLDYTVYSPETVDKINALDIIRTKGDFVDQRYRDLIRFRVEAIDSDNPVEADSMIFRAFLDTFADNYTANHNTFNYNGRGEDFYTYNKFRRKINIGFKIAAQSRHEMMPLYRKLNFLVSNVAPEYKVTRMRTPFIRLTIGSMIDRVPGIINSISLKWDKDYPWEIAISGPERKAREMLVLPHVLDVTMNFTPVHNFLPQKSVTDSPFILSHTNNRSLQNGEQWYKAEAAESLDEANVEGLRKRMGMSKLKEFDDIIEDPNTGTKETVEDVNKGNEKESKDAGNETSNKGNNNPAGAQGAGGADAGGGGGGASPDLGQNSGNLSGKGPGSKVGGDGTENKAKGSKGADAGTPEEEAKKEAKIPKPKSSSDGDKETKVIEERTMPKGLEVGQVVGERQGIKIYYNEFTSRKSGKTEGELVAGVKITGPGEYNFSCSTYEDFDISDGDYYDEAYTLVDECIEDTIDMWKWSKGKYPFSSYWLIDPLKGIPNDTIPAGAKMEGMTFEEVVAHEKAN